MSHYDNIKSLITPVIETKVLPKFMYWLLADSKYGAINQIKNQKIQKVIQPVIDLYKEWIDTGIKPSKDRWVKARTVAAYAYAADAAYAAAAAAAADAAAYAYAADAADAAYAAAAADAAAYAYAADAAYAAAADAAYAAAAAAAAAADAAAYAYAADAAYAADRAKVEKIQIRKLNEIITEEQVDIHPENNVPVPVVNFWIDSLKKYGYSVVKTEDFNKLKNLEKKLKELLP